MLIVKPTQTTLQSKHNPYPVELS